MNLAEKELKGLSCFVNLPRPAGLSIKTSTRMKNTQEKFRARWVVMESHSLQKAV